MVFKTEIVDQLPEAPVSTRTKRKVIHNKGTDEVTTHEEIKETIVRSKSTKEKTIVTNHYAQPTATKCNSNTRSKDN